MRMEMERSPPTDGTSAELVDFGRSEDNDEDDDVDKSEEDDVMMMKMKKKKNQKNQKRKRKRRKMLIPSLTLKIHIQAKERLAEETEYGERNAKEAKMELEEQRIVNDFQRAEEKKDPRDRSYWRNPATELVGGSSCKETV